MIPAHGTHSRYSTRKYLCRCDKCRRASSEYQRQRRLNRPDVREQNREQARRWYKTIREYINNLKDRPCTDCGIKYPPYVMQFDHLDGSSKEFQLARMKSIPKVDAEVAKCELVCANCHAERTHKRRI